ncbi:hypothetical protein [Streptomyces paludis]|uniref:Uncharacterized protein n=1 Tax=Streptomyces paludis TaxID=2282738 RepID=A0A345HTD7_9ACTN|nr:hypothetical protein [Streptomyces paludis]AXG79961.1 hypothetical protein DVK44_22485 [Streptomyces paludis]
MCVSMDRAEFSETTLYAGRLRHPEHGLIHVLGYQNTAVSLAADANPSGGGNAMLLHLPARRRMGQENFLSVGRAGEVLSRMVDAVWPMPVGAASAGAMDWMGADDGPRVEVFEHDIYTVLLADDPTLLPAALARVPWRKRPRLDPELLEFYAAHYPGHSLAVCCFDNTEAARAKPLMMWYAPHSPDLLVLPALDCHTGGAPDLTADVPTDHCVLYGTDVAPEGGAPVDYPAGIRHELRGFLPRTVMGAHFGEVRLPNGDFALHHDDLLNGRLDLIHRLRPGSIPAP